MESPFKKFQASFQLYAQQQFSKIQADLQRNFETAFGQNPGPGRKFLNLLLLVFPKN
jgi:hypothetical protein